MTIQLQTKITKFYFNSIKIKVGKFSLYSLGSKSLTHCATKYTICQNILQGKKVNMSRISSDAAAPQEQNQREGWQNVAKDGSCGSLTEEVRSSRWSVRTVIPDSGGISVRCRSRLLLTVHRTNNCFLGTSLYFLAESLSPLSWLDGNIPMLWSMEIAVGSDSQSGYNGFLDPKRTSG